ncbi:MAG: putative rane protein [Bacteroidetes bacterium]|nr:putative rane protein [Bacteroidota bacterium]
MEFTDILSMLFRWLHIAAGILWIGLLYWFNFVNGPFAGTMDGDTKKKVVPELMPRALYFFRWGALWTWVTGLLLLLLVFYHGKQMFPSQEQPWTLGSIIMVVVTFFMFFVYDLLAKSLGKDIKVFGAVAFVVIAIVAYLMFGFGGFGYRAYQIHLGTMFGTIMLMNVWMRIWPSQRKIIGAVKEGTAPDAALVALAGQRSRHNVYMSVPLVWTMVNLHTVIVGEENWWAILVVVAISWWFVSWIYDKSAKVKGF